MMPRQMPSAIFASQPALDAHRRPSRQANGARDTGARDGRPAPTGGSGSKIGSGPHDPTGGSLQVGVI